MVPFDGQSMLPAAKSMKQFEAIIDGPYTYGVLLDTHIAQLNSLLDEARRRSKNPAACRSGPRAEER